jgi:hypothetical protein
MYGRLATILGYRYDEIEKTPLSFIITLCNYWVYEPPVHDLARAHFGYKAPKVEHKPPVIQSQKTKVPEGDLPTAADMLQLRAMGSREFGGQVLSFDCLPLKVQEWARKNIVVDRRDKKAN